jgi:hypothetical protein
MTNSYTTAPVKSKTSWRNHIKVHPAAEMFPMMSDVELDALAADIKKNGLQHRAVFWATSHKVQPKDYQLVDGRNRIEAMVRAGIQVDLSLHAIHNCAKAIPDPYAYVVSANIQRRHLTSEQKRELIAKLLKLDASKSDNQIGKMTGAHNETVAAVRKKLVETGDVTDSVTRTDTKGRKQPAQKSRKKSAIVTVTEGEVPGANYICPAAAGPEFQVAPHAEECGAARAAPVPGDENPITKAWRLATEEQRAEFASTFQNDVYRYADVPAFLDRRVPAGSAA